MDRFPQCLTETLRWEGGWSNDPVDPGGATMCGIIQVEYNAYCDRSKQPRHSVRQITRPEIETIYRGNYWVPARCAELPPGVDMAVWDYSVNSGCGQAIKSLQRVLGLPIDGHLGSVTMAAVHQMAPLQLIRAYMDERRRFLRNLKTFWRFGKGWMSRCDGVEAFCLAAVTGSPALFHMASVEAMDGGPLADVDAQSASQGRAPAESPAPPAATEATVGVGGLGGLAAAAPGIVERSTIGGHFNAYACLAAVLSDPVLAPMLWLSVISMVGALMFYLHRRKLAA